MADGALDKIKEQYLETIVHAMPVSQAAFLILMSVVFGRMMQNVGVSPIDALSGVSLAKIFDKDDGFFWTAPILAIIGSLFLSICNTSMINFGLRRSFFKSKVGAKLNGWKLRAQLAVAGLTAEQVSALQLSLRNELEKRQKKLKIKRLTVEIVFSIVFCMLYGSIFTVARNLNALAAIKVAYVDLFVLLFMAGVCFFLHRGSVRYAISKVIPLQVFIGAAIGDLVFIDGID